MLIKERRAEWSKGHKQLKAMLEGGQDTGNWKGLFHNQHAFLNSSKIAGSGLWSYQDFILEGLVEKDFRLIPPGGEHSIVWILWHLSRIEDVTMNVLVADRAQVFNEGQWAQKTGTSIVHTGNEMAMDAVHELSKDIDIHELLAYRHAVCSSTQAIVRNLDSGRLSQSIGPDRLQRIWDEEAVLLQAKGIVDYWSRKSVAGLLLMPPTRHALMHLNEAFEIKERLLKRG